MAPDGAISPLRIQKSTSNATPLKANGSALSRPLAEISPMERRRNSPSYNQATKQMVHGRESSPFDSSPYGGSSPRAFWQGRASPARFTSENHFEREQSPSVVKRRSSIEKLKQASRVKNSSMFAREHKNEYDPTSVPLVERPLAAHRPLAQFQGNAFGGKGIESPRQDNPVFKGHRRGESQNKIPLLSPSKSADLTLQASEKSPSPAPPRSQASPTKSSLSNKQNHNTFPRSFDPQSAAWSDDEVADIAPPRALRRHAKSVTFDTGPPEINEYEMVTPDPSSVASDSREGSYDDYDDDEDDDAVSLDQDEDNDDSFDASLEDTDKTPVVLPEDWRHMSPEAANTALAQTFDDPFQRNDDGRTTPSQQWNAYRTASVNSDSEPRPLPPVPGFAQNSPRPGSSSGLASVAERVQAAHAQRSLPTPPRAAGLSKSDILGMKKDSVSLEDRFKLMGFQDQTSPKDSASKEAARLRKHGLGIHVYEDEDVEEKTTETQEYQFPRISRESILRKVKSRTFERHTDDYDVGRLSEEREYDDIANLDPDVPIPSREVSSNFDEEVLEVQIKQEDEDDAIDVYSIPEMYSAERDYEEFERDGSVIRHDISGNQDKTHDDEPSFYSPEPAAAQQSSSNSATDDEGPPTPKAETAITTSTPRISGGSDSEGHVSLPELSLIDDVDFQSGLASYLTSSSTPPPPPPEKDWLGTDAPKATKKLDLESVHEFFQHQEVTPDNQTPTSEQEIEEPGTPDSVLHHPVAPYTDDRGESPGIPEPVATIKAPGTKLKTRPSATPADIATLAAARRQVSGQMPPPIPDKSPKRLSMSLEPDVQCSEDTQVDEENAETLPSPTRRRQSFKPLDIAETSFGEDISFGLDREFDRVIESSKVDEDPFHTYAPLPKDTNSDTTFQLFLANLTPRSKKGYIMRQNTKVVVAKRNFSNESGAPVSPTLERRPSSAHSPTRSAGNSPRKPSHERSKSWTTEPWNGKVRRKSIRTASGSKKPLPAGPVPPLPGQESAVSTGLDTVMEDQIMAHSDDFGEDIERGRLFVKVVGVKELDLPLPQNERTYFQLTLDNGLHCVTTSWLELGRSAPIGQEFELVVLNELEFQLTLQTKLTVPPKPVASMPSSPTKSPVKTASKKSSFSHLLMSPKKRREAERLAKQRQVEEEEHRLAVERHNEENARLAARKRASANPTAWDLLHELVSTEDGSFGRAYVCLKNHESQCFGRPMTVDMPIFNEWALEDAAISSSVKSKRGGAVRRPPYQIGKLTLQLLYIPRPKGMSEDFMPKSMSACVRELRDAEEAEKREFEGFLSQQGGDCPYWRRRFFRLTGTKLTAYHETTRQPRAKIDLSKAVKIIDDKSSLVQPDAGTAKLGKGRRKSAFAEEDEGYQFVEEGFRIRFANGETIDFYADSAADKESWIQVFSRTVGKSACVGREWCQAVLAHERKTKDVKAKSKEDVHARPQSADGQTRDGALPRNSVDRKGNPRDHRGAPVSPNRPMREAPPTPQTAPQPRTNTSRRKQIQSMIF